MSEEKTLSLNIGELIVTDEHVRILTTLGSCVSICLFSPQKNVIGMIHFALPYFLDTSSEEDELRYGDRAIPQLIAQVQEMSGMPASFLKAKVIGGANCLIRTSKGGLDNIGEKNIQIAYEILKQHNIEVVGNHCGGEVGRKVIFHSEGARVQVASLTS